MLIEWLLCACVPFSVFEKVMRQIIPAFVGLCFSGGKEMNIEEGDERQDKGKKIKGNWALLEVGSWVGTTYFIYCVFLLFLKIFIYLFKVFFFLKLKFFFCLFFGFFKIFK